MMFQMLQATSHYSCVATNDMHLHLRQFLEVARNFKIHGVTHDFRLSLFPYSPMDKAKGCLNSLKPNSIATWKNLVEKFLVKHFPLVKNIKMRNEITSF